MTWQTVIPKNYGWKFFGERMKRRWKWDLHKWKFQQITDEMKNSRRTWSLGVTVWFIWPFVVAGSDIFSFQRCHQSAGLVRGWGFKSPRWEGYFQQFKYHKCFLFLEFTGLTYSLGKCVNWSWNTTWNLKRDANKIMTYFHQIRAAY